MRILLEKTLDDDVLQKIAFVFSVLSFHLNMK